MAAVVWDRGKTLRPLIKGTILEFVVKLREVLTVVLPWGLPAIVATREGPLWHGCRFIRSASSRTRG